ncbi:hypothetical protein RCL1_001249 [Eukaryota sp. TZLM3-RCL]
MDPRLVEFSQTLPPLVLRSAFTNKSDLLNALMCFHLLEHRHYKTIASNSKRLTLKCAQQNCHFHFHASESNEFANTFVIASFTAHSCSKSANLVDTNADASFLATLFKEHNRKTHLTPTDVKNKCRERFGLSVSDSKALRIVKAVEELEFGSLESSFEILHAYCLALKESDDDNVVELQSHDGRFKRIFIAFNSCLKGFCFCKKVISVDGCHLKHKLKGILLIACSSDAVGSILPIAFAVVNSESYDNWMWFLSKLKEIIPEEIYTVISDRQKGLIKAVDEVFKETVNHAFCIEHLKRNMRSHGGAKITHLIRSAAEAKDTVEMNRIFAEMKAISPKGYSYLSSTADPAMWCDAVFAGNRFGHYSSNISESLNAWLAEERKMPVVKMLEFIRRKLMRWFYERKENATLSKGVLVKPVQEALDEQDSLARRLEVVPSSSSVFEVLSSPHKVVDLEDRSCSCGEWQKRGRVCVHVQAVMLFKGISLAEACVLCYTNEYYRKTYETALNPVLPREEWDCETVEDPLLAPTCNVLPGRPPIKRKRRWDE